jgi:hypothetical protein
VLGDFANVRCTFERVGDGGAVLESRALKLSELSLAPLDVVYGVPATGSALSAEATPSDIEARVVDLAQRLRLGASAGVQWRIQHARPTDLASGELALFDVLQQARAVRRLLGTARSVTPQDLSLPSRTATSALDLAELEARVVDAEASLIGARETLVALAQSGAGASAQALRTSIVGLADFGFTFTVPFVSAADDPAARAALSQQASGLLAECSKRVEQIAVLRRDPLRPILAHALHNSTSACAPSSARRSSCCRASRATQRLRASSIRRSPAARRSRAVTSSPSARGSHAMRGARSAGTIGIVHHRCRGARHGRASRSCGRATAVRRQVSVDTPPPGCEQDDPGRKGLARRAG